MSPLRIAEGIIVAITLVGMLWGAANFFQWRRVALVTEIELRQEILNRDIKKDAEARAHYKGLSKDRPLEPAETSRLEYLEEQLEGKYEDQKMYKQKALELK